MRLAGSHLRRFGQRLRRFNAELLPHHYKITVLLIDLGKGRQCFGLNFIGQQMPAAVSASQIDYGMRPWLLRLWAEFIASLLIGLAWIGQARGHAGRAAGIQHFVQCRQVLTVSDNLLCSGQNNCRGKMLQL